MPISESMVQDIVQEVMAKMQIADAPAGKHGIFTDMNEAIEAAKASQKIVRKMSLDQREKIITCIRRKTKENAEILARMGVDETEWEMLEIRSSKHHLVADKTPGTEDLSTTAWSARQRTYSDRDGTIWRNRESNHSMYEPCRDHSVQHNGYAGRWKYSCI